MPAPDTSSSPSIWLSVIGLISLIITVIVAPIVVDWVKAKIARRTPPGPPPPGLNAPIDRQATNVTGVNLEALFSTVTDLQMRLDRTETALDLANKKIESLERDQEFYSFVMQQALHWGANGPGDPPRVIPEGLRALLERGGWM